MKAVIYARCNSKVIYSLDRFAKNRYESAEYKYKLKRNGVSIFSTKENITDDVNYNFKIYKKLSILSR